MMMEEKNAVIKSARLTKGEKDILDAWLQLDYGGSGQGFGGYALYLSPDFKHHELKSVAGHFIFRVLEIAGVDSWKDLPGKSIRVKAERNKVHAIGHIIEDDWFDPKKDFDKVNDD
jgi:hypothetical protein